MELKDTLTMMVSDDYAERLKAEYIQIRIRLIKLEYTVLKYWEEDLPFELTCPVKLLEMQIKAMEQYLSILEIRAQLEGIDVKSLFKMEYTGKLDDLKEMLS